MQKFLTTLTTFFILATSWCTPALAGQFSKGSLVLAPPLISQAPSISATRTQAATRMRLPSQAGKVSKLVTTKLVSNSPTWIAKGDKYYSLCAPKNGRVACAPIVATSVMQDIEVGALAGPKGEARLTFKIARSPKQTPQKILLAIDYFLVRANKQAAHFGRIAAVQAGKPGLVRPLAGNRISKMDGEEGEGECIYDDYLTYDCTGGEGNDDGADENDWDWGPDEPLGGCEGNCDYPAGNDNGDPCAQGNCPVVIIPGERPANVEELALPNCRAVGPVIECGRIPPVIGAQPEELPKGATPWFPQSWCDFAGVFCSARQVPYDRPPPLTDEERRQRTKDQCYAEASAMATYCRAIESELSNADFLTCMRNAIDFSKGCELI